MFRGVFENKGIKKICQNGKYDIAVMKRYGIHLQGFHFDTMLASYIIDPDQKHGMDALSEKYLNYVDQKICGVAPKTFDHTLCDVCARKKRAWGKVPQVIQ